MQFLPPMSSPQIVIRDTYGSAAQNGVKCAVYGGAGVGKTVLTASMPQPFLISAEGGTLSLNQTHVPYVEVKDMAGLMGVYQWAVSSHEARQFWSLGMDSASEVAEVVLANELKNNKDPRKAYGELATQMMALLRAFRDIPQKHVLFTAKQGRLTDQQTGAILWGPMMPGQQLDQQFPYMFDEVFHMGMYRTTEGQTYRALRTQPDNQYQAKDRSGRLDMYEQANLTTVFNKIMGL